jgi:hypothetical protein
MEVPVSSRPAILIHVPEQVKRVGRPRQWANEAERKRAYRQRRATELANPLGLREAAQKAHGDAAESRAARDAAVRDAEQWRAKAAAMARRAEAAERRATKEKLRGQRLVAERDEARRLLRRKLQWASHAEGLRRDPDALLVLVAELYADQERLRKKVASLQQRARSSRLRGRADENLRAARVWQLPWQHPSA